MFKGNKTGVAFLYILALVLCFAFIFTFTVQSDVAYALLPAGYVQDVIDKDLEWWSGDNYFGLSDLKQTVNAWKESDAYDFNYLKANPIIISIIDTGVNIEHELFSGKYDEYGNYDASAVDKNGVGIYDVILRDGSGNPILKNTVAPSYGYKENDVTDDEWQRHGTHVAGIIAMLIHSLGLEQYIKILPIKASYHTILNEDKFSSSDVREAIEYAVDKGADVINMSLSSDVMTFADIYQSDAYKSAVLVAAAGNEGKQVKRYPAALPNVIGVMNYTYQEGVPVLSSYSNYGEWSDVGYDICAPGTGILSANGNIVGDEFNYKPLSGTSMAAPFVSFGTALLAMKYKALAGGYGEEISSEELADLVRNSYSLTITKNDSNKDVGVLKVFDINKHVDFAMYDARIDVDNMSLLRQRLGSLSPIGLRLNVVPSSEYGNGNVEWFIGDEKIAEGFEIEYMPDSTVGERTITAVWNHNGPDYGGLTVKEASVTVSVEYMLITALSVATMDISVETDDGDSVNTSSCKVGETYHFEASGLKNVPADDAAKCMWFVDGEFKSTGESFDFTPTEDGKYQITLSLNGFRSMPILLNVVTKNPSNNIDYDLTIFTIVFSAVVAAVAVTVIGVLIAKHKKKNKSVG